MINKESAPGRETGEGQCRPGGFRETRENSMKIFVEMRKNACEKSSRRLGSIIYYRRGMVVENIAIMKPGRVGLRCVKATAKAYDIDYDSYAIV
jgi:hypothetical protein